MNLSSDFLELTASELGIKKGAEESEQEWKARIIYSMAGRVALASLRDEREDEQPCITDEHFKGRIKRELEALFKIAPEKYLADCAPKENKGSTVFEDEIYDIYLKCGFFYHASGCLSPVPERIVKSGGISLIRGCGLQGYCKMCGLGLYLNSCEPMENYSDRQSVEEMYHLQMVPYWKHIERLIESTEWQPLMPADNIEYLRIRPPFSYGYWMKNADAANGVSLLRYKDRKLYYFYKLEGQRCLVSQQIPDWLVEDSEYRIIANWLLMQHKTLPASSYRIDGERAIFSINYLYPPEIQYFIKLYSWPESMRSNSFEFKRVSNVTFFQIIRQVLEPMGYQFSEEP